MAGPEACPWIVRNEPGLSVRPPLAWELQLMEGCLRDPVFCRLALAGRPVTGRDDGPSAVGRLELDAFVELGVNWQRSSVGTAGANTSTLSRRRLDRDRARLGGRIVNVPGSILFIRDQPRMRQVGCSHPVRLAIFEGMVVHALPFEIKPVDLDGLFARVDECQARSTVAVLANGLRFAHLRVFCPRPAE